MSILFSGDFHANADGELSFITKKALVKKYQLDKYNGIQYHIILGDGGFLWPGNQKTDIFNYKVLACRPFPVLCVIGNHEPILGMSNIPEIDIGIGETVYQINANPFVAYLKRGKAYTIDGFKFLVLGGALSIDKDDREPDKSWWEKEYWTRQEKRNLFKLLESENTFDCVLSHTGPNQINKKAFNAPEHSSKLRNDKVARFNDQIDMRIQCHKWWCGHWHSDIFYYQANLNRGYQYLYRTTKILDWVDNKMLVYNEYSNGKVFSMFSVLPQKKT
jgi:3-oxoacid CoA-transferase subunit A